MKKTVLSLLLILVVSFVLVGCAKSDLRDPYIEIDSDIQNDYEVFIIPNDVNIFNLTDADLESYWINTNDVDRYVVKLYESNHVITVEDSEITIRMYNQNGFYYVLVEKEE